MELGLGSPAYLILGLLVGLLWFGFIGGLAGAITGGERKDRSPPMNAGIGLLGSLIGGTLWFSISQEDLELTTGGFIASLVGAILLLLIVDWVRKRRSGTTE